MRITLVRFRCYVETYTREFSGRKLTLINGKSGVGKTTILEGILWCLYGGMLHIYPSGTTGSVSSPTCVLLEFSELGGLYIRRIQPPNTIEVGVPGSGVLTGVEAQAYIESIFGPKDFYITSSYIQQNTRCPLITGSNAEKTQLLHELTFGGHSTSETENPEMYLTRIDTELVNLKSYIGVEMGKYNALVQMFTTNYQTLHDKYLSWVQRERQDLDLTGFEAEGLKLRTQLHATEDQIGKLVAVESKVSTLKDQLTRVRVMEPPIPIDQDIHSRLELISKALIQASQYIGIQAEIESLSSTLKTFDLDLALVSDDELQKLKLQLESIRRAHMTARSLGFDYAKRDEFIQQEFRKMQMVERQKFELESWMVRAELIKEANSQRDQLEAAFSETIKATRQAEYELQVQKYEVEVKIQQDATLQYQKALINHRHYIERIAEYQRHSQIYESLQSQIAQSQVEVEKARSSLNDGFEWYLTDHVSPGEVIEMGHLDRSLQKIQAYKNQLYCPHCKGSVLYTAGTLTPGTVDLETALACDSQIKAIVDYAHRLKAFEKLEAEHERLSQQFKGYTAIPQPPSPHVSFEKRPLEPKFAALVRPQVLSSFVFKTFRLEIPSEPKVNAFDATLLTQAHELEVHTQNPEILELRIRAIEVNKQWYPLSLRLQTLKDQIALMENVDVIHLQTQKSEIETQIAEFQRLDAEYSASSRQAEDLKLQLSSLDFDQSALTIARERKFELEGQINQNQHLIAAFAVYEQLDAQNRDVETSKHALLKLAEYEASLVKLKTLIQEVASNAMEETVDAINFTCNAILHDIFEADIQVLLKTHKELKTKGATKLQVNLQVIYKSQVYDSPARLSGGEQDRISLALTLAMSKLSSSPILLLDEVMPALNEELRELCLEAIQEHLPQKTILSVCHSATKGLYDCTVDLCCPDD